jgi:hypothetical protein
VPGAMFVSGAGSVDESRRMQILTLEKAAATRSRMRASEGEWCRGFVHGTRRTHVQGEPARLGTRTSRLTYHAGGRQTTAMSCRGGALCARSRHDNRCHRTFYNATEGKEPQFSTRGLGKRQGAECTYVTSLHEGEGLAAEEGVAVGGVGVLLPEIAG